MNEKISQSKSLLLIKQLCSEFLNEIEKLEFFDRYCEFILTYYPFDKMDTVDRQKLHLFLSSLNKRGYEMKVNQLSCFILLCFDSSFVHQIQVDPLLLPDIELKVTDTLLKHYPLPKEAIEWIKEHILELKQPFIPELVQQLKSANRDIKHGLDLIS